MDLRDRRDARRLAVAIAAAVVVHAGLLVVVPLLTSLDTSPLPDYGPVIVRFELPEAVLEPEPAPAPAPEPAPPVATPPRTTAKPAPAAKPATTTATAPKPAVTTAPAAAPARAPGTSAFRQSGATTGVSAGTVDASIPQGPPPVTLPAAGVATTGGDQRAGEAVALTGPATGGSGTIDPTKVDKALAASAGTTGGSGSAAPGATSPGTAATTSALTIEWDDEDAAEGRVWVKLPRPDVADKNRDFLYGVRIWFRVNAEGLVTEAKVERSGGQLDVDEACRIAVLNARVTPRRGAPPITGVQVFVP